MAAVIATAKPVADENAGHDRVVQNARESAINSRFAWAGAGKSDWIVPTEQIAGWLKRTHPEDEYNQAII